MTTTSSTVPAARSGAPAWIWLGTALFAHTAWGAYPVLARYLQTVSHLPTMAMLALGNFIALAIYAPYALRRVDRRFLSSRVIWAFTLVVVVRAITNVLAARFTLAIYVQLITLMTPLLVALLSAGLFREKLPPLTWPVIGLSLLGALLTMSSEIGAAGLRLALTQGDMLGIAMALASAVCLSVYMILVPRTVKAAVSSEAVLLAQLTALSATSGALSLLLREDWGQYARISPADWAVFCAFVVFVLLGANLGQITALRRLGAPLVSSTMAWRLVATIALAALLLGERLTSLWQAAGAAVVLASITVYLWRQRPR
ncbi:MAG: hypothetical protein RLZZ387_1415 [Chloroflexota bacterium]|jgi:drug/metabolite transporter (DMT)-like permease